MASKMLSPWTGDGLMHTRIGNGTIITIRVISGAAIVIAMGMILTVIGASIYGMLGTSH